MNLSPLAGKPADPSILVNIPRLMTGYYMARPNPDVPEQRVVFGTSGHRGSSLRTAFNEGHILAITQAICLYRKGRAIDGPLFLGMDTHALSEAAMASALEVLAANEVEVLLAESGEYTPTPAVSHAIISYNRGRKTGLADGIVVTPSHNPPEDGGFKYNPPHGGPAESGATAWIEAEANRLLREDLRGVKRTPFERALRAPTTRVYDYLGAYVDDLGSVLDMNAIRGAGLKLGVDPLGGAGLRYWPRIAERYGLDLITLKDTFDIAFACDPDHDRHGIVTRSAGLLPSNHYLAVAIHHLFADRREWREDLAVGKTMVSSSMIDRVTARLGRRLYEVPVGFKWFVDGLLEGRLGFAGEESAGAAFLRRNGTVWTTDKDGIIACLLSAEITARGGRDPGEVYRELTHDLGDPIYERIEAPLAAAQRAALQLLSPDDVRITELAGEKVSQVLTAAPGDGNPMGGVKVVAPNAWFAVRPSGTEEVYKLYAESFLGTDHLRRVQREAETLVTRTLARAPS